MLYKEFLDATADINAWNRVREIYRSTGRVITMTEFHNMFDEEYTKLLEAIGEKTCLDCIDKFMETES